jgi:ATP-binding cassette subfamily B protein
LGLWLLIAGAASFLGVVCGAINKYHNLRLSERLGLRVQEMVLQHASRLDLATLEDKEVQNILARANQAGASSMLQFTTGVLKIVSSILQVVGLLGVVLWIQPFWSLCLVLSGLPLIASSWFLSIARHRLHRRRTSLHRRSQYYSALLTQRRVIPAVRILDLTKYLLDRHLELARQLKNERRRLYRLEMAARLTSSIVAMSVLLAALWIVARQAVSASGAAGTFVAFWAAAWRLRAALTGLAGTVAGVVGARLSITNTMEFLRLKPSFVHGGTAWPAALRGEIVLRKVSFRYPGAGQNTLEDLSLQIRAGEIVALVGHNGAGKTTLAKLIACLYQPTGGEILIDGISYDDLDIARLYNKLAFVSQEPVRFEATAGENIAFGDWRRLLDNPDEVRRIAAATHVDDMIRRLPQGYQTFLGRSFGYCDLSGGQWQKLAIARSLACEPSIVILDEPAANLDVNTEADLYRSLCELVRGRTTIVISHRFSTVRMADRILVLDEGRLVEQGTHDELLRCHGTYAAMWHARQMQVQAGPISRAG